MVTAFLSGITTIWNIFVEWMNKSVNSKIDPNPVRLASCESGFQSVWKEDIQTERTECARSQSHEIIWRIEGTTSLENQWQKESGLTKQGLLHHIESFELYSKGSGDIIQGIVSETYSGPPGHVLEEFYPSYTQIIKTFFKSYYLHSITTKTC